MISARPARARLLVLFVVVASLLAGCEAGLPRAERLIEARPLTSSLQGATGIVLTENEAASSDGQANLVGSWSGGTEFENLLVLVFDSSAAADLFMPEHQAIADGVVVFRRLNVVILYERAERAPNRTLVVRRTLDALTSAA